MDLKMCQCQNIGQATPMNLSKPPHHTLLHPALHLKAVFKYDRGVQTFFPFIVSVNAVHLPEI